MTDERSAAAGGVAGDIVRAVVVAGNALLAFLAVVSVIGAVVNLAQERAGGAGEFVARIAAQQVVILGLGATVTIAALAQSIRLWLRGSWHVTTVLLATVVVVAVLLLLLFYTTGMGQH